MGKISSIRTILGFLSHCKQRNTLDMFRLALSLIGASEPPQSHFNMPCQF